MEDNIQTIIVVIISVFILFIFPVYMAYEKKDDISYALAMRYTQDLVDEVRDKGYISKYMYDDYRAKLKVTGNSYDIQLTHEYNRYDPITNYYKVENGKYTLVKTTSIEEKEAYENKILQEAKDNGKLTEDSTKEEIKEYIKQAYTAKGVDKVEDTYKLSSQIYTTDHIENVLNSERKLLLNSKNTNVVCSDDPYSNDGCQYAYVMNVDDNFNVTIKNTNITLATVIYNMVTANTLDENTRIYVNYGGTILSNKWYGSIDYSKMDHDKITLDKFVAAQIFEEEREYNTEQAPIKTAYKDGYTNAYNDEYAIEFDVKPNDVTVLREKGDNNSATNHVRDYTGYNFAAGNGVALNGEGALSISVGLNGISLIAHGTSIVETNAVLNFEKYKKVQKNITNTKTCQVRNTYTTEDENGEQITTSVFENATCQDAIQDLTNYSKINVQYKSNDKFEINLTGKNETKDAKITVIANTGNKLQNLNYTKNNPTSTVLISGNLYGVTNLSGTPSKYNIRISKNDIVVLVEEEQRIKITDYDKLQIQYINKKLKFTLSSSKLENYTKTVDLVGQHTLLDGYDKTITDLNKDYNINRGTTSIRGTNVNGNVDIEDYSIVVNANKKLSNEMTILSYPIAIKDYITVKIEVKENNNGNYVAILYINGEKTEESIAMETIPKVNVIGKTIIGNEERFFDGNIRNVKVYYYQQ